PLTFTVYMVIAASDSFSPVVVGAIWILLGAARLTAVPVSAGVIVTAPGAVTVLDLSDVLKVIVMAAGVTATFLALLAGEFAATDPPSVWNLIVPSALMVRPCLSSASLGVLVELLMTSVQSSSAGRSNAGVIAMAGPIPSQPFEPRAGI